MMKEKGFSTYQLREKCGIDSKTIRRLRANDNMETKTLNKLCTALDCRLEDIAEYVPDEGESKGGDFPSWHTTFAESLVSNPKFAAMMQEKINMKVDTAAIDQEIANYEKQLRQSYSIKSKLMEEIDSLDPDDRHYIKRKADLDDRLY